MRLIFVFILCLFCFVSVQAKEQQIDVCEQNDGFDECFRKFQIKVFLAKKFNENYSPEMGRMLTVTAYSVELMKRSNELAGSSAMKKKFYQAMISNAHHLALHGASIKYEELGEYSEKILSKLVDESVDLLETEISRIPLSKLTPSGVAVRTIPGMYEVSKTILDEFPKQSLMSGDSAKDNETQRAAAFKLLNKFVFSDDYKDLPNEMLNLIDDSFASTIKHSSQIDELQLSSDEDIIKIRSIEFLFRKNNKDLVLKVDEVKKYLGDQISDSAEKTMDVIKKSHADLTAKSNLLLLGQVQLLEGQNVLSEKQSYIIKGVDFLTQLQMEKDELERINKLSYPDLVKEINKKIDCHPYPVKDESDLAVLIPSNLEEQACRAKIKGRVTAVKKQEKMHQILVMENINKGVEVFGHLASLTNDRNLQKIASDAQKVVVAFNEAQKALDTFESMKGIDNLALQMSGFLTGLGAITTVIKLFGSSGPSADELILKELAAIRKSIAELHQDMLDQFSNVQIQLKQINENLNDSLLAQNRFISENQLRSLDHEYNNANQIIEKLMMLDVINQNFNLLYQRQAYDQFLTTIASYKTLLGDEEIINNFDQMTNQYAVLIKGIDDSNRAYQQFYLNDFNYLEKSQSLFIRSLSTLKNTNHGKNILLSSLVALNQGANPSCREDLLNKAIFANLLTESYADALTFYTDETSNGQIYVDHVLQSNAISKKYVINQLQESLDVIARLQKNLENCFGLETNEERLLESLFNLYHSNFKTHLSEISREVRSYEGQILNEIRQSGDLDIGPLTIFNGIDMDKRANLDNKLMYIAKDIKDLDDADKASELFMKKKFPKIKLCYPDSATNINRKQLILDFPKQTVNQLIKSNHLKVALATGLIDWDFCIDIGGYNQETSFKDVHLIAKQKNQNNQKGFEEKIMAMWPLKIQVPESLSERASANWKQTYKDECFDFKVGSKNKDVKSMHLINPETKKCINTKEVITYESQCEVLNKRANKKVKTSEYIRTQGFGFNTTPSFMYSPYFFVKVIKNYKYNLCEHLDDVVGELWTDQVVNSDQAWTRAKTQLSSCQPTLSGMSETCFDESSLEGTKKPKDNPNLAVEIAESNKVTWGELQDHHNSTKDWLNANGMDLIVERGVVLYYLKLKEFYSQCYGAMLKGLRQCSPVNASILLTPPKINLKNLMQVFELFVQAPFSFYTLNSSSSHKKELQQQLVTYLSQMQSPLQMIDIVEDIYKSGEVSDDIGSLLNDFVLFQEQQFKEQILPLIKEHFIIDRSIMLETQTRPTLEKLKNQFLLNY